eukprot:CAMPEP_0198576692 /NCGR_PEP_ID=MMETSP1462-20131121/117949_1 /TAXON_ID=1333877 /ORGANISM="Brandtodinium nutriculum, Strain RCC3387" /LENGTH=120 /DNA_ID=CAMNT_0044307959 /DNA_START=54 /DNA_END=412 /DNA_ORIENTATION=+
MAPSQRFAHGPAGPALLASSVFCLLVPRVATIRRTASSAADPYSKAETDFCVQHLLLRSFALTRLNVELETDVAKLAKQNAAFLWGRRPWDSEAFKMVCGMDQEIPRIKDRLLSATDQPV